MARWSAEWPGLIRWPGGQVVSPVVPSKGLEQQRGPGVVVRSSKVVGLFGPFKIKPTEK